MVISRNNLYFMLGLIFLFTYYFNIKYSLIFIPICLFITIISQIQSHQKFVINNKDRICLLLFFLVLFNVVSGTEKIFNLVIIIIYPWMISLFFQNIKFNEQNLLRCINCIGMSALILGTLLFFNPGDVGSWDFSLEYILSRNRQGSMSLHDSSILIGPTQLSSLFGLAYLIVIYSFKLSKNFIIIKSIMFAYIVLIVIVLSSRTTWAALVLLTLLIVFKNISLKQITIAILLCISSVVIIMNIDYVLPGFNKYQLDILSERMAFITSPEERVHLGSRLIRWNLALDLAQNNYFGRGYSYFDSVTKGGTPHNEILGQLVGVGYLGLFLVLCIYGIIYTQFKLLFNHLKKETIYLIKLIFIYIFIISLFENYSYAMYNKLYPLIWIVFGMISSMAYQIKCSKIINVQ